MKTELKYIEQKTGFKTTGGCDNGPAWIARVKPTKSGKGFYFNGYQFSKVSGGGPFYSNYHATDDNYY